MAWFTFKDGKIEIADLKERSKIAKVEGNKVKVGDSEYTVPEKKCGPQTFLGYLSLLWWCDAG